jgi:hypothetical protein
VHDTLATIEPRLSKVLKALRLERSLSGGELAVALFGLGCVGLLALAPRIQHGGFSMDDWSNAVVSFDPPGRHSFAHAISEYASFTLYRPVLVIYVPLTYFVFGMHMHYHLAWAAALSVLVATMFYGVLRTLNVPWVHAALISALTIVFPWSDTTRLWATTGLVDVSVLFLFAGMLVGLQGLRRRSWRWHAFAVVLYLLSMLTYELTLPVVVCAGALYYFLAGWQAAKWRWLADVAAAVAAGLWVWFNTVKAKSGISGDLTHLGEIVKGGGTIVGRAGYPLGSPETTLVLVAMAVVLCVGFGVRLGLADRLEPRRGWDLDDWLALTIGGLALTVLGWVMLIPAEPYYTPSVFGEVNRVNGLAAFGLVVAVYGSFGIVSSLLCQLDVRSRRYATAMTVLLGAALLVSYTHVLRRHIQIWNTAYAAQAQAISKTKEVFPHLAPGTTLIASNYPANQAPGVPILATSWDYNGMIRMEYHDVSMSAFPLLTIFNIACRPHALVLEREGSPEAIAPYGTARLLNLSTGTHSDPKSQSECKRVVGSYVPGPSYLSDTY